MSTDIVKGLSQTKGMTEIKSQATMERWNSGVLESRESQVEYLRELDEGYAALERGQVWIEGQKTIHGAYVYRNLWLLTDHGRKKIVDPIFPKDDDGKDRAPEPLGTIVQRHLGKRDADGNVVKPLASGTSSRYAKVARLVFEAGYSMEDSLWPRLTSQLVDDSEFIEGILDRSSAGTPLTRKAVEDRVKAIDTPVIETVVTETETEESDAGTETETEGTDSQVPETETGETETETGSVDDRAPRVPAHEITEGLPRGIDARLDWAETVLFGLKREDVLGKAERVRRITVLTEHLQTLV